MLILIAAAAALTPIDRAVAVHFSAAGLARLGAGLARGMPTHLPVTGSAGSTACDAENPDTLLEYELEDLEVGIHISSIDLVPSAGRLDVLFAGTLDSTPAALTVSGDCPPLVELAEVCTVTLPVTTLSLRMGLSLTARDGLVDATVDTLSLELSPIGNPLDGCTLASAVGTLLGQDPEAINRLFLAPVEESLIDAAASMEASIEEGLAGLATETHLPLGDSEVLLSLAPTEVTLSEDGLLLGLSAELSEPPAAPCASSGAEPTVVASDWPSLDGVAPVGSLAYDAAFVMNKALIDQILWAAWRAGTLCVEVADLSGTPLDSALFNGVFGEPWQALFPEPQPLTVQVQPAGPLTARFSDSGAPFRVVLDGLSMSVVSTLDARLARIFRAEMVGEMGLDVSLSDGSLVSALVVNGADVGFTEPEHELLPAGYSDGLASLLPTLLSTMVSADLLPTTALPSWQGLGLGGLWWMPSEDGAWMGGYAVLDIDHVEPIELPGCDGGALGCDGGAGVEYDLETALGCTSDGGCAGDSGCGGESACSSLPGGRISLTLVGALAWMLRRRRA